ncbi:MAG: sugar phosphate nucleotidyltransferase [Fibrobacteraceae bacterium]
MKVILPVAGTGTRLRPFTLSLPKCLLPIAGKTLLDHIIDSYSSFAISEQIFITGYKGELVEKFLKDRQFGNVRTVVQSHPQGLGEAISLCLPFLTDDEPVLIILGDTLFEADLSVLEYEKNNVLMTREVEDPRRFGVAVKDKSGVVTKLVEKPENFISNEALVGIYYITDVAALRASLTRLIKENIRTRGEFQLTDALQMMLESGCIFHTSPIKSWLDCGTPETFLETNSLMLSRLDNSSFRSFPGSKIIAPCYIADSAVIRDSVVGPNVSIGPEVSVMKSKISDSVISERVSLRDSEISHSIFGEDSEVCCFKGSLLLGDHSRVDSEVAC